MAVKESFVKVTTKKKLKEEEDPSFDVPMNIDELLAKKVIDLPESMCCKEISKVGDNKYCKFYCVLGHPKRKIIIDLDETAEANHTSVEPNQKKKILEGSLDIDYNHKENKV
ncbi:hypothetical protein H5410_040431 [Solanum commersonii]|uniref:Uncharacterized protein n=1 Tax=Solanum commersonii TaxID=4109 RepID=A0A9J5XQ29_SOLCO|nr:hypothetical protein H5410_040431 [Solanum commersonii]